MPTRAITEQQQNQTYYPPYHRAIIFPKEASSNGRSSKIVKAMPNLEVREDPASGLQKFRVKLFAERGGRSTMNINAKPVGSFFLCFMILLSFAAVSSAYVELGTATILNDSYNFSGLCDASTAEVPSNELYAIGVNIFNDGAACGMIYTVACEAGNCVAENNISVDVKIIDGIFDPHPSDKTLTMILSRPAFNKIATFNATSISINYRLQ